MPPRVIYPEASDGAAVRWLDVAGGRVRCVEAGRADAPPVLLLGGWGCSAYSFRHNLPALAGAGFRAIAVEPPGLGWSDKPPREAEYTLPALARSVVAILEGLGVRRAPIVGQSLGGGIALQVAHDAPERVDRLVLWSPIGFGCARLVYALSRVPLALAPFIERVAGERLVRRMLRVVYGSANAVAERDVQQYAAPLAAPRFVWSQMALLRNVRWQPLAAAELDRLALPITIVAGAMDPLVPIGCLSDAAARLPDARLRIVRGGGHAANETHAGEVNRETLAFLRVPDAMPRS